MYDNHREEWDKALTDVKRRKVASTWIEQDNTLDRWRHNRMYNQLRELVQFDRNMSWLTVGDGRYGTDANALLTLGATDVMCSDISDTLLKIGHKNGFIKNFSMENAENLSFKENEFDFTLCKEAYHHFPRPHIALHEMLRVSRIGVILIEPCDASINPKILNIIIPMIKKIFNKPTYNKHRFEEVGNYIFTISERELEKVQLGMHRQYIAYKYINDFYQEGFEFILMDSKNKADLKKINRAKKFIKIRDILTRFGLIRPAIISALLFKHKPNHELLECLRNSGWEIRILPPNPYLKKP